MYLLSFLNCAKHTVVCDQIANKSFVLLNASILREYREKPSLRSASHARHQDSVTGGHKQILGEVFITKSAKKQFLLTNFGVITSILGVSGLELHFCGNEPVTFFGSQSSLGGRNSCLGGTCSDLGRHGPGMPPVASGLLQVYSNLSNCNYHIFVKEILLENEEMRTM